MPFISRRCIDATIANCSSTIPASSTSSDRALARGHLHLHLISTASKPVADTMSRKVDTLNQALVVAAITRHYHRIGSEIAYRFGGARLLARQFGATPPLNQHRESTDICMNILQDWVRRAIAKPTCDPVSTAC